MQNRQPSFHSLRAEQVSEFEQRLEKFLMAEERRISRASLAGLRQRQGEDLSWHAKTVMFEVCVNVSLRRSQAIRAFLAAEECSADIYDSLRLAAPAPVGAQLVLQCLGANVKASNSRSAR